MKFCILSHAGLMVEHRGVALLVDPWIVGSCYWRSWWNFPEPEKPLIEHLDPDAIYLTHLHWDHFHSVSLRRFDRSVAIYVPKVPTRRMVDDLAWLGFTNVHEIDHGGLVHLGPDFVLHSYQFGLGVDSAAIVTAGGVTLFDCNDCKYFGLPLRQIKRRFPRIDFVFRSHSSARAIPYCIDGYKERFADYRTREDYSDEFAWFAIGVGARYAIPFASNHCFLHPDTLEYNATAVTPEAVAARCERLAERAGSATRCVVMPPGSVWEESAGFAIVPFDYAKKAAYVEELQKRHGSTIAAQVRLEAETLACFADFTTYFTRLSRSLPWPLPRLLAIVVFRVRDSLGTHCWLVDWRRKRVSETSSASIPPGAIVIETPALVINDCTKKKMFSVWTASKRLKIFLDEGDGLKRLALFFLILDFYELDMIPLHKNLRPRALGVYLARWREAVEAARMVIRHKLLRRPFSPKELYHPLASKLDE